MKILIVSGIWPPDVGGPASHAPDVAEFLLDRGHEVEVVITADTEPAPRPYIVRSVSRALPKAAVHARAVVEIAGAARRADVVYTTGMFSRTAAALTLVRRPFVIKLTGDPAFERARRRNRVGGDVETFQHAAGGVEGAIYKRMRDATLRRAAHVVCPSGFLRDLAVSWGVPPGHVTVLPNPAPLVPELAPREDLRQSLGIDGPTLVFAGRFGPQKALDVLVDAVSRLDGVTLLLVGEGEEQPPSTDRTRLLGSLSRERVLEVFRAADASVLASSWENFPHTVVEALAVGTPVIATRVGGVPEVIEDGVNGLLVEPNDPEALAQAIRRFFGDPGLRGRLAAAAAVSIERYSPERIYGELEQILERAAR